MDLKFTDIKALLTGAALDVVTKKQNSILKKNASTPKAPNWNEWQHSQEVRVWQACALSLGIDPHSMTKEMLPVLGSGPFFEPKSFPSEDIKAEFERRQNALFHNLSNRNFFLPGSLNQGTQPGNRTVRLAQFAAWAVLEANWDNMPQEFRAMAALHAAAPVLQPPAVLPVSLPQSLPSSEPVLPARQPSIDDGRTIRNKLRTNSLDVPIKKAMKQANSSDMGAVYLKLKELALNEEPPFTGELKGAGLCYTRDDNVPATLTKNALGKRIKNLILSG